MALSSKMHFRLFTIFSAFLLLAGCSNDVPREKIYSFLYSTFYLKVIDQHGQPVPDVETDVRHGGNSFLFGSNSGWAKYISDSDGMISIKVDSRQISFDRMARQGYSINLPKILFEYYKTRPYGMPGQGDLWQPDFEKYSKQSPFIISAWKIDKTELLAECKNGMARQLLNTDGRIYEIDLLKSGRKVVAEGTSASPVQIKFNRGNATRFSSSGNHRNEIFKLDWNYALTVTNGGLVEIKPESLYKKSPPLSGYSKSWRLTNATFQARSNEYGGSSQEDDRHFYLKLSDQTYARLSIRFKPVGRYRDNYRNGALVLDYSVNIDGSRIVRGVDEIAQIRHRDEQNRSGCLDFMRGSERKNNRIYP